jgi:hypothetical protein
MADEPEDKKDEKEDPWGKLGGVVRKVVQEELTAWQEKQGASSDNEKTEETEDKKPERRKGFLESFFEGLT